MAKKCSPTRTGAGGTVATRHPIDSWSKDKKYLRQKEYVRIIASPGLIGLTVERRGSLPSATNWLVSL
jgi:hypothetical protein